MTDPFPSSRLCATFYRSIMLLQEFRLAFRLLARQPVLSLTIVLALGLGIGLTATMYSVVHGIFLRDLPFRDGERLIQIDGKNLPAGIERMPVQLRDYLALRKGQKSFEDLAAWSGIAVLVSGSGVPAERLNGALVSSNLFALAGVSPFLGRTFSEAEAAGQEPVVIISNAVWKSRLGGSHDVTGKTLKLNGESRTVIGVMPPGFQFPLTHDFWLPLPLGAESQVRLQLVGKIRRGVSLTKAQAELDGLARGLAAAYPETNRDVELTARPYIEAYSDSEMRSYLGVLMAAVFGVLLVACANTANLLLFRATLRNEEMAVRQALGAGSRRLFQQLLAEALVLSCAGGLAGALLTLYATGLLQKLIKPILRSFWVDVRLDGAVLGFAAGLTLLCALLAGLYPALRASRPDLMSLLREQARGRGGPHPGRLGQALVVLQVGLACGLLVATGLSLKSVVHLSTVDLGFEEQGLLAGAISLPRSAYPEDTDCARYFERMMARVKATAGVQELAVATGLPLSTGGPVSVQLEGVANEGGEPIPPVQSVVASEGYFRLLGTVPLAGRDFSVSDDAQAPAVAIVNQSFARRHGLSAADLPGRRIRFVEDESAPWVTIIGIVADLQRATLPERQRGFLPLIDQSAAPPDPATVYLPVAQAPQRDLLLLVRTAGNPGAVAASVRATSIAGEPELPLPQIRTLAEILAEYTWDYRLFGAVFLVLGLVALGLATVGLYAVMALSVSSRTAEFGLRSALGAPPGDALRLALRDGLWQLGAGVLLGLVLALVFSRLLTALLYRVAPWDPVIFAAVAAVLAATGIVACLVPARRASRADPLQAMRAS